MKEQFPESIPPRKKRINLKHEGARLLITAITAAISGAIGSQLYETFHSKDNPKPVDCPKILTVETPAKEPVVDPRLQKTINENLMEKNRNLPYYPEDECNGTEREDGEIRL